MLHFSWAAIYHTDHDYIFNMVKYENYTLPHIVVIQIFILIIAYHY